GLSPALAKSPATYKSACRRACSWTSRSTAAKLAGSVVRRSSHSGSRSANTRPVWSATSAGEEALRPCGRPRFCFGLSRPMGGSSQSRCTSIPRPPPRATSIPVAPPRSHRHMLADHAHSVAPFWDQARTKLKFNQFGLHATLEVKTIQALYYKAGKDRLLTIVLTRDLEGKRPDQMFYCTKLDWTPRQILSAYACRWAIECTFENCKQFLGLEDPANRLPKAVARTAPMALFIYSLVVVWFHKSGHQLLRFPFRPWYRKK